MRTKDLYDENNTLKLTVVFGLATGAVLTYGQPAYAENTALETSATEVVALPTDPVTPVPADNAGDDSPAESETTVDVPTVPTDSTVPTDLTVPMTPTNTTEEISVDPTLPTETSGETTETPEEPVNPDVPVVTPETPVTPGATETPTDSSVVPPSEQPNTTEPSTTVVTDNQPTTPTTPQVSENNNTQAAPLQPQVDPAPTVEEDFEPIVTDQGYTVISTENSVVTVANVDGTRSTGRAEDFGGVTNQNGTVSFITKEGKKETLPETGVIENIALTLLGFLLLLFGFVISGKNNTPESRYIYL
ncbi:LPXTG cell wall anchor domain-containing protein [Streptococcus suis]|uniref:LPXTG cell wall anchor domain-containing protein n=1 Tax=Streptococcus suis TaxID=1307 RepID=UPI00209BF2D5|nr:LPXTG cell wall anchor domain-containing protein [Streptococcus suis]MCO8205191.1 LPXTG cell wall anchor domain-containing protein [Streptococcus suis]HEM3454933.1 LPXTG cell wall anchor domain-containing protein [Streptococcus suis]